MSETTYARDGCAVPTAPLADLLHSFVVTWNREHPVPAGRVETREPLEWLATQTAHLAARTPRERGVPFGQIDRIYRKRGDYTQLRDAELLVAALDRTELFYDDNPPTLPIVENPHACAAARALCCSGSMNGSAFQT